LEPGFVMAEAAKVRSGAIAGDVRGISEIRPVFKAYCVGTHRDRSPAETVALVMPLAPEFGITRVANLTGLDRTGIPVIMVCRPNARSSAVFHGKGIDLHAAKASGIMEAIETWHAEHVQLPLRFASFAELGANKELKTTEVDRLPRMPASQFDVNTPMLWVEGRNLMDGEAVWTPYELVTAHSTINGPPTSGCFNGSTNGLASGNHVLEATSHALCELIERDATALWRQSPEAEQNRRRVDLVTVDDAACLGVLDLFARAEIDLLAWDVTTDVGVPTFQCFAVDRVGEIGHIGIGAGCHPARNIALFRAMTEAAQVRSTYIVGSREDIHHVDYHATTLAARHARIRGLTRLVGQPRDFASIGNFEFETFEAEVAWLLDRLRSVGIGQAIAVDLTRPEFGIPVMRMVVPGLEGFDHNLASYVPGLRARTVREGRA
jgi:ribosomal protein S12 methylthiotransferase accessory factor